MDINDQEQFPPLPKRAVPDKREIKRQLNRKLPAIFKSKKDSWLEVKVFDWVVQPELFLDNRYGHGLDWFKQTGLPIKQALCRDFLIINFQQLPEVIEELKNYPKRVDITLNYQVLTPERLLETSKAFFDHQFHASVALFCERLDWTGPLSEIPYSGLREYQEGFPRHFYLTFSTSIQQWHFRFESSFIYWLLDKYGDEEIPCAEPGDYEEFCRECDLRTEEFTELELQCMKFLERALVGLLQNTWRYHFLNREDKKLFFQHFDLDPRHPQMSALGHNR